MKVLVSPHTEFLFILFLLGDFPPGRSKASREDDRTLHKAKRHSQPAGFRHPSAAQQNEVPEANAPAQKCPLNTGSKDTQ